MKVLIPRKQLDDLIIKWEKDFEKMETKESLPKFLVRKQAIYLLNLFIEKGFLVDDAKIELKKLLDDVV